jgi:2-desacetyl-2-hydroxyethyl bacteriochlorophyllide A dehydrogenase
MKALVHTGSHAAEVRDVPFPATAPSAASIKIRYCGLCGTDLGIHAGKHPRAKAPLIFGHEFVGRVHRPGSSGRFSKGDRVVAYPLISCRSCYPCRHGAPHVCAELRLIGIDCDGGMAEYASVDESALFKVPDSLGDEVAALVEPLAVVVHALHQAEFKSLDHCVVMGSGPIGVLTALLLRRSGASSVIVSDIDPGRLALCRRLGFDAVDARDSDLKAHVMKSTDGDGADIVFECSGTPNAALDMTELARVGGTICLTGVHKAPTPVRLLDIGLREQRLIGTRVYTFREFGDSVTLAQAMSNELEQLITHVVPLSDSAQIFEIASNPAERAMKILVDCGS